MYEYPVTLSPDEGTILVTFPDVPEAITYGDDEVEALLRAADALETAFIIIMADKRHIPTPSEVEGPRVSLPPLAAAKVALYQAMCERGVGKAELARRLGCHLPQVDRLLNLRHASRLDHIDRALRAVGKALVVEIRDAA